MQFSWSCAPRSCVFQCLNVHLRSLCLGFQEVVCRVACSPSYLLFSSVLLNHVSARPFHCITENDIIPTALIPRHLPRDLTHPHSHSAVGRIALWSFHCLKVVDKWQTRPRYLGIIGSRDALEFLSLRKISHAEKCSHFEPSVI